MKKYLFILSWIICSLFGGISEAAPEIQPKVVEFLKPKLNSDRIEYFFGSYGVDPLEIASPAFPSSRISNLYSIHQGKKIMRTLAVVDFFQPVHPDLTDVHHEILEGKSVGIALREEGWNIKKSPVYFGMAMLSPGVMDWMDENCVDQAALHVY